jgi:hypothetical protein
MTATGGTTKARHLMCDQHRELRQRLAAGIFELDTLTERRTTPGERLRSLVGRLYDAVAQHQTEEEELVLPILESDRPVGPLRANQLRKEHARQRAELEALRSRQEADDIDLVLGFDRLARTLLLDIAHEERLLLVPG